MPEIRRAVDGDIDQVMDILREVADVHVALRPDLFIPGATKYTARELASIFRNDETPVFVAEMPDGKIAGYAFCFIQTSPKTHALHAQKTLYIDDICVASSARRHHVASLLFECAEQFARSISCDAITLNVWEGNGGARAFYEKMGMFARKTQMELKLPRP